MACSGRVFVSIASPALLAATVCLVACGSAFGYYSDNFSTDKALSDSYLHSPVATPLPETIYDSVIGYGTCAGGTRALGFASGPGVGDNAFICYRFPVCFPWEWKGLIHWGTVAFRACPDRGTFHFLKVSVWCIGGPGGSFHEVYQPGWYTYDLTSVAIIESVLVQFEGDRVLLDDLLVDIYTGPATDPATWGRIKSLYR